MYKFDRQIRFMGFSIVFSFNCLYQMEETEEKKPKGNKII